VSSKAVRICAIAAAFTAAACSPNITTLEIAEGAGVTGKITVSGKEGLLALGSRGDIRTLPVTVLNQSNSNLIVEATIDGTPVHFEFSTQLTAGGTWTCEGCNLLLNEALTMTYPWYKTQG